MGKPFKETKGYAILKKAVPGLLTEALGGIPIVGGAAKAIMKEVLGRSNTGEIELSDAEKAAIRETILEIEHLELEDRQGARNREVELGKAGVKNHTQNALAFVGVFAFFGMAGFLIIKGMKNMSTEESFIVGNVTGIVGSIATSIYSYYFGSSKGSKENADVIRRKMLGDGNS